MIILVVLFVFAVVGGALFTLFDYGLEGTLWWEPVRRMRREREHAVQKRAHELEGQGFDRSSARVRAHSDVYTKLRDASRVL